jgi:preprotein translocase subunit SecD
MKITTLSLLIVLFASACSQKSQNAVSTGTSEFPISAGDVVTTSVEVVTGRVPSSPTQQTALVHLQFSPAKAAEFRKFTREHLNQQVQITIGTNVVAEPVIRAELSSPKIELGFPTAEKAQAVADSLSKK